MEVFRLTPEVGKKYVTAEYTSSEGKWPDIRYFTTHELQYVGEFRQHVVHGYRDNAAHYAIFSLDGKELIVAYTYEGTTCFKEV